ncbi:MAG: ABC transporter ATP-binding protein [Anaerolineales bacterium]|uniref:ABC-type quaternary amine transporter n=1 Tax=Candidatus Desulfolinea nitratireducens TaxID=2841698 RepID=A0A8J6NL90_9CHLR|nr:ABC transporter ATP-binding protein [Candidatus Desulfolinea nitratireducens]MBL6959835.1 ABC transporter ATP-binding protein [Anaerolineales bacterium]
MLILSNIHKSYEGKPLLRGISLEVGEGETICLLGPSGGGKTTLLRIIAGLENAEEGEVNWNGKDISSVPPHKRNFGLIFQDYALFPHLNVFDNVAFGLKMQKLGREEIHQRVMKSLQQVDLIGLESRDVIDLSGGEQQRVALARALAPRPHLLLFDEPLGALDRKLREYLLAELRSILQESGVPAIYVTHDQDEAFTLADRVMLLHNGEIVQRGTPAEVYARPHSGWVAEFLGAGNVVQGKILKDGLVETIFGTVKMPVEERQAEGSPVTLLIRPRDVRIGNLSSPLRGTVKDVVFQQDRFKVVLKGGFYFYLSDPVNVGEEIGLKIEMGKIQRLAE